MTSSATAHCATVSVACRTGTGSFLPLRPVGHQCAQGLRRRRCVNVTLAKVIALISQADGSLGQIPQNHFYALEVLRVNGNEAQKQRLYAEVLAGQRFGNALAELGTKTAHDRVTQLRRDGEGYRINGRKFYATGAIYAQRIPTSVVDENGVQQLAFVPATAKA